MKNKIHYSLESRRDLDDIWDYIVSELQNRSAAERVTNRIMDAVDQLKIFAGPGVKFCVSVFRQSQEWLWKAGRILA